MYTILCGRWTVVIAYSRDLVKHLVSSTEQCTVPCTVHWLLDTALHCTVQCTTPVCTSHYSISKSGVLNYNSDSTHHSINGIFQYQFSSKKVAFSSMYSSKTNIINWVMSVPWLKSGSTGKYHHTVKEVPSTSCWYFPVLPSSRLGTDSVPDYDSVKLVQLNFMIGL